MKKKRSTKANRRKEARENSAVTIRHLGILLAAGVLLRVIYDIGLADNIFLGNYILDSLVLHSWAMDILNGRTADIAFFRAPLYPYLLALVYKTFGVSPWSAILCQNLLGLLTAVISYFFARRLFGKGVAFWAALLVAVYPTLIYFEGETMITTLAVFLFTLSAFRLYMAVEEPTAKNVVKAGLILGVAAITRPTILPLVIIIPVAFLAKYGVRAFTGGGWIKSLVIVAAMFIPILPVTFINLVKGGEFVLISTQGGVNFYIGNSKDADGITVVAPGPNLRIGPYNDNIWTSSMDEAERRTGRELSQSEVSSFWFHQTFSDITDDVGHAARLYLKKFYLFWHGQEIFNNKSLYYAGEYSTLMKALLWKKVVNFPSGTLFPLMFAGLFFAFRDRRDVLIPALYVIMFALVVALFFVCARFRQPLIPFAIMLAVYGTATLGRLFNRSRGHFLIACGAVAVMTFALNAGGTVESKQNLSQFHVGVGSVYLKRKDYANAVTHLERSLQVLPDNMGAYDLLGQAYLNSRQIREAEATYLKAKEMFPTYAPFNFNLGRISQMRSELDKAKEYYHLTLEYAPDFALGLAQLGNVFEQQQQLDSALYYFRRLQQMQPRDTRLKEKIVELERAQDSAN
ncbi:MAG: glycosyltransferase family 39 protein [bacterium]